ncbi:MAG TPA: undecaprenyldiphospho-muramoylpentapeptide beta-N-acetylglucosaminyltransferase [Candidatus Eisenbacteria bacterium]|nr:undecaprenyldiphospho-muramoylpentapeptide beta-N-acetylglucosaminyltransferase [Candidatus Eisenbacteria bacterium]
MKIVLACGGTGGHIFPAFSVAEELKRRHPGAGIIYVCGKKDIENAIFKVVVHERVVSIESAPFAGAASLCRPSFLLKLFSGFRQALSLLKRERPDVVVGFGGHYSFPAILAAKFLGIRTLIHEQNVVPGKANKLLARIVDGVALSFPETRLLLPGRRNMKVTGNPIRSAIERGSRAEAMAYFGFSEGRRTALVLGGSQGAESINTLFLAALRFLPAAEKEALQVLHLCGRMPAEQSERECASLGVRCRAYSFFERMDLAYAVADFAVGRAGATFLAEISVKRVPAILIPYPFSGGHQLYNARAFAKDHAAVVAEQKDLTAEKLAGLLTEALRRTGLAGTPAAVPSESRARLADFILEGVFV